MAPICNKAMKTFNFVTFEAFMATECGEVFSGDQPCEKVINIQ